MAELGDALPDAGPKGRAAMYVGLGIVGIAVVYLAMKKRTGSTAQGGYPVATSSGATRMVQPTGSDPSTSNMAGIGQLLAEQGQQIAGLGSTVTSLQTSLSNNQQQLSDALAGINVGAGNPPVDSTTPRPYVDAAAGQGYVTGVGPVTFTPGANVDAAFLQSILGPTSGLQQLATMTPGGPAATH